MPPTRTALKLLAAVATMLVVLITGLGFALYFAFVDTTPAPLNSSPPLSSPPAAKVPDAASSPTLRDSIADAPMMTTNPQDATGGTPALAPPPPLLMPASTTVGALGVGSGFPPTPEGAAAQLGQIMVSTLQPMDLSWAGQMQQEWFQDPGDSGVWPVMLLIQGFLERAGMPLGLEPDALMAVVPVAAQVKGVDGRDWVVACVLLDVTYTRSATARLAYGHCERMAFTGGRWLIAEGSHPPPAPSTWPGTDLAAKAGWLAWVEGERP